MKSLCQRELENLSNRLSHLGRPDGSELSGITSETGGVGFSARLETACLANLFMGLPTRILMRIASFRADSFSALERHVSGIDWELLLPGGLGRGDLAVQVAARKSRLYHTDAVADRVRRLVLDRLNTSPHEPSAPFAQTLMVRAEHDRFTLSLDMSGPPLFKRGIKRQVVRAPIRETLACAILSRLEFTDRDILVDPMCGSGTFSLEAAMMRASAPHGIFRQFAFESWPGFGEKRFRHAQKRAMEALMPTTSPAIFASDLDPGAVNSLKASASAHHLFDSVRPKCEDFFDIRPPDTASGVVVLNPPYGLRLGKGTDINGLFREIGLKLTRDFRGWRAGVIYPERRLERTLGLKLTPMPLFHGGLDLFAGIGRIS